MLSRHLSLFGHHRRLRFRRGLGTACDGLAAIEFAFMAPLLCLLLIGAVDFGRGLWCQLQVASAAQAGAVYASTQGWNATAAAIENAVTGATSLAVSASPAPAWVCGCPNTSAGIAPVQCGSFCPDGSSPPHYVTVTATATYSPLLPYPKLGSRLTLSSVSYARLYP